MNHHGENHVDVAKIALEEKINWKVWPKKISYCNWFLIKDKVNWDVPSSKMENNLTCPETIDVQLEAL